MLAKLATLAKSKAAIAALGVVLVGGGSGAVAVAATTGHLSTLGVNLNSTSEKPDATETSDSHADTKGFEGLLTGCTATTITVKSRDGVSTTFVVSSTTKFNGDTESESAGASTSKGDSSTHVGGSSTDKGGDSSAATGGSSTEKSGDSSASHVVTLADVCAAANINTRDVQVQATKNGSSYDAWKVTLQGRGSANGDSTGGTTTGHATGDSTGDSTGHSTGGDSSASGSDTHAAPTSTPSN